MTFSENTTSPTMEANGLFCEFNMPDACKNKTNALPPYNKRFAYAVDEYPACPTNWMNGSDKASSYFVPVKEGKGLWLDFNKCGQHSHHVAIVISIQGINPITGQPTTGQPAPGLRLEQYKEKCPVHDVGFQQDRFCPECKFKWPAQNYLSSIATPYRMLWLDGFIRPDGTVEQYILTLKEIKSIAKQIIGDDRVFAIGVAFYLSKEPKPQPKCVDRTQYFFGALGTGKSSASSQSASSKSTSTGRFRKLQRYGSLDNKTTTDLAGLVRNSTTSMPPQSSVDNLSIDETALNAAINNVNVDDDEVRMGAAAHITADGIFEPKQEIEIQDQLEIGAGQKIEQGVYADTESLDFYQDTPAGLIYINYVSESDAQRIIVAGRRKEKEAGYLNELERAK